jgi:non-heme chloroperoxidase
MQLSSEQGSWNDMPFFKSFDRTELHYKDWGQGRALLFVHGNSVASDWWKYHMTVFAERGFRCLAYDSRGFGRSEAVSEGFDYTTQADDLAALLCHLDLSGVTLIGQSFGCAVIARYVWRYGTQRVTRAILVGTVTPFLLQTDDNPDGIPAEAMQQVIDATRSDRPRYFASRAPDFFAPGVSAETVNEILAMANRTPLRTTLECARFAMTPASDVRRELTAFSIPTLIVHGAADTFAPCALTAERTARAIPMSRLLVYENASHGLVVAEKERFAQDCLTFIEERDVAVATSAL